MAYPDKIPSAVIVECTALPQSAIYSYSGFRVIRTDTQEDLALFYCGDPFVDFDDAEAYAKSVGASVLISDRSIEFWKDLGVDRDREVSNG